MTGDLVDYGIFALLDLGEDTFFAMFLCAGSIHSTVRLFA